MERGSIKLETRALDGKRQQAWVARLRPHESIAFKRLMGKADRRSVGEIVLADTLDVCRDLAWFLQRFTDVEVPELERLRARAAEHEARELQVRAILGGARPSYVAPAFELSYPPREYQRLAADLWTTANHLLCADDLGLGKTMVAIAGLAAPGSLPALVVTETHLVRQWVGEIHRFAPNLRVWVPKDGKASKDGAPVDIRVLNGGRMPDVVVLNYAKLRMWAPALEGVVQAVVFDECQALRTGATAREGPAVYTAAQLVAAKCRRRLGLSATPIYNYGGEMFSILEVLAPGALGTYEEFAREWCSHSMSEQKLVVKDPRALGSFLRERGLMLRRTRRDVGRELPALTRQRVPVDADMSELAKVSQDVADLARIITGEVKLEERGAVMQAAGELDWKLRQATGLAKAPFVADFVRLLLESEDRVLLCGWHHAVYQVWAERLKDFKPVLFTGEQSAGQKDAAVKDFTKGDARVLVMSIRSGAGLNGLQEVCRTIVHGEPDWSPGPHDQADGRLHRDGQKDPVMSYFPISDFGSDPIIADVLGLKVSQAVCIRDPDQELVSAAQTDPAHVRKLAEAVLARGIRAVG